MASTVALFPNIAAAKNAVNELKRVGFQNEELSVLVRDNSSVGAHDHENSVAEGVATGGVTGGAAGALAGLLVGLGLITIPGVGPFLAAGPFLTAMGVTGAAATTAMGAATGAVAGGVVGGVAGALTKAGLSKEKAEQYEGRLQEGAVLVGVNTDRVSAEVANQVLTTYNAESIDVLG